jgi:hypothetical protein
MKLSFKPTILVLLFFSLSTAFLTSCQKESSQNGTADEQEQEASRISGEADAEADVVFNNSFDDAMGVNEEVAIGGTGIFSNTNSCPVVTIVRVNAPNAFPVRVIMDFGINGCVAPDGHFRKGKVIITYSNRILIPGATAITEFDNFYFDSTKVEGTHKITNTSTPVVTPAPPVDRKFKVEVINGKLTRPTGNFVEWNSTKFINQVEGLGTSIPVDDIFRIEGTARGKVKRGPLLVLWESNIVEPLVKRFNCRWIVRGKIRTVRANIGTNSPWIAVLDFGNGNCDNLAIVTINGIPHQITLP